MSFRHQIISVRQSKLISRMHHDNSNHRRNKICRRYSKNGNFCPQQRGFYGRDHHIILLALILNAQRLRDFRRNLLVFVIMFFGHKKPA